MEPKLSHQRSLLCLLASCLFACGPMPETAVDADAGGVMDARTATDASSSLDSALLDSSSPADTARLDSTPSDAALPDAALVDAALVDAALPDTAADPDAFILNGSSVVRFADRVEAAALLVQRDAYIDALSPFDRSLLTDTEGVVTEDEVLAHFAAQARDWQATEKQVLRAILATVDSWMTSYALPFPLEIFLVKTDDPAGRPFTRLNYIVFPASVLTIDTAQLQELVTHELFHILSRHAPGMRASLYAVIGFYSCAPLAFPDELAELKLTNPDSPVLEHCIDLYHSTFQQDYPYIPITFSEHAFSSARGTDPFDYLVFRLQGVELRETESVPLYSAEQLFQIDPMNQMDPQAQTYFQEIGSNTQYIIHPDEILADNFVYLLRGDSGLQSPWVSEQMVQVLNQ